MSTAPAAEKLTEDVLRQSQSQILPYLNLATLLPLLQAKGVLSQEDLKKVDDDKHHTIIERTLYLMQGIYRKKQSGIDTFVQCLREEKTHSGHAKILEILFKKTAQDAPTRSPVLAILDSQLPMFEAQLNLRSFMNTLVKAGVISVSSYNNIIESEESKHQKLVRLIQVIQNKGVSGFIRFFECLLQDVSHEHDLLAMILIEEVKKFLTDDPKKQQVPEGDRKALLDLEKKLETTKSQRAAERPVIRKEVGSASRDSSDLMTSTAAPLPTERQDRLAVLVCMDRYVELTSQYRTREHTLATYTKNEQVLEQREKLQTCLLRLQFRVVHFAPFLDQATMETGVNVDFSSQVQKMFKDQIVGQCHKGTVVFIYLSGIQFPFKINQEKSPFKAKYAGALLTQGEDFNNRSPYASIRASDLKLWVERLPTPYVTFLFDCHHSHIAAFGEERKVPKEVDVMEEPWRQLVNLHSNVVLYYLRPDVNAMARLHGTDQGSAFGKLTEQFVKALVSWLRRNPQGVSHRQFFEAISFHWHKKERCHLLYTPAVQGDVDRSFLNSATHPYHQVFRADLVQFTSDPKTTPSPSQEMFNLKEMQIPTGTLAGLKKGDELEVFHVLQPEMRVSGRITKASQLFSFAQVREEDQPKFDKILREIYSDQDNYSKDGTTQFVHVKKKFPLHMRQQYTVALEDMVESDSETLKRYIKEISMLLSVVPAQERANAKIVVRRDGDFLAVEDREGDLAVSVRVNDVQKVKSMLELLAWFKYVRRLKQQQRSSQLKDIICHLTADKPLLTNAPPLANEFELKYTSYVLPFTSNDPILHFSDRPKFWVPEQTDRNPCLEVQFKENHILSAVELRGDSQESKFVRRVGLTYQKQVPMKRKLFEAHTRDEATYSIDPHCTEPVKYITIHPLKWTGKNFSVSLRVKVLVMDQDKTVSKDLESLTVANWPFHVQRSKWRLSPTPNEMGVVILESTYLYWLNWTGETTDSLTLVLATSMLLDRIEMTAPTDAIYLEEFELVLHTDWLKWEPAPIQSAWPTRLEFPLPLVISTLQLWPLEGDVRLQLQLHGNKHGEALVVEEGAILTFYLSNNSRYTLFVYLFCLEETGMVKLLFDDVVRHTQGSNILKKLLRTEIPQDYNPPTKQIVDMYRAIVSPRKLYLEPFIQRALRDYHTPLHYGVCSYGRRTDIGHEELWCDFEFKVIIKRTSFH